MSFDQALKFTLACEGGLRLTNHEADHGGATYAGLTQATCSAYFGKSCSTLDMQALTPTQVSDIYRKLYWAPLGFDDTDNLGLTASIFDAAVVTGLNRATMILQACLGVSADGKLGPISLAAMRKADPNILRIAFAQQLVSFFCAIAQRDKTQQKWLGGWLARAVRPLSAFPP